MQGAGSWHGPCRVLRAPRAPFFGGRMLFLGKLTATVTLRKLTSLLLVIGFLAGVFHPLADAGAGGHGVGGAHSLVELRADIRAQSDGMAVREQGGLPRDATSLLVSAAFADPHGGDGLEAGHCETCHVFSHLIMLGGVQKNLPAVVPGRVSEVLSSPFVVAVQTIERPPRSVLL